MTSAYTAMIPDMTTGMRDFIIRSGLYVPMPAIPMPDFAVPNAAPMHPNIIANAIPAMLKKGANLGENSFSPPAMAMSAEKGGGGSIKMGEKRGGGCNVDEGGGGGGGGGVGVCKKVNG